MRVADAQRVREFMDEIVKIVPPKLKDKASAVVLAFEREFSTIDKRTERSPQANAKISATFARRRDTEIFSVDHAEDGERVEIIGWLNLCRELGLSENSLRQRFSTTKNRAELTVHGNLGIVVYRTFRYAPEPDTSNSNRLDVLRRGHI